MQTSSSDRPSTVLTELAIAEVASAELALPITIGVDLVNENGPVLAAVPDQISLTITVDIEPPHHP
jgi:hypothetical protein